MCEYKQWNILDNVSQNYINSLQWLQMVGLLRLSLKMMMMTAMITCQRIDTACLHSALQYGNPQVALNLSELLCNYHGQLQREELQNTK